LKTLEFRDQDWDGTIDGYREIDFQEEGALQRTKKDEPRRRGDAEKKKRRKIPPSG